MEYGAQVSEKPSILIYASISRYNGRPALVLRRVITDPETIKLFALALLRKETVNIPAIITTSNKLVFVANAKRLGIIP